MCGACQREGGNTVIHPPITTPLQEGPVRVRSHSSFFQEVHLFFGRLEQGYPLIIY